MVERMYRIGSPTTNIIDPCMTKGSNNILTTTRSAIQYPRQEHLLVDPM